MWAFVRRVALATGIAAAVAGVLEWRRGRLAGEAPFNRLRLFLNQRVNPWLLSRGLATGHRAEIGTMEHIGRRSGDVHLTPVHPTFVEDRVWIPVPYGGASQWARNVLASGHCRLQFRDMVYDLDEPHLVPAVEDPLLPKLAARAAGWLGVEYLRLHVFAVGSGTLVAANGPVEAMEAGRDALVAAPA